VKPGCKTHGSAELLAAAHAPPASTTPSSLPTGWRAGGCSEPRFGREEMKHVTRGWRPDDFCCAHAWAGSRYLPVQRGSAAPQAHRLHGWHASLFLTGRSGMKKAGAWRDDGEGPMQVVSGPLGRQRIHFEAPAARYLPRAMGHSSTGSMGRMKKTG
jgi:hypothetical protein